MQKHRIMEGNVILSMASPMKKGPQNQRAAKGDSLDDRITNSKIHRSQECQEMKGEMKEKPAPSS
jgi:hypothetical protein